MNNMLFLYFIFYFVIINVISFFTMWYDKRLAQRHDWRISEKALFILALLLGGIGIYAGMYRFRHKTKHTKFTIGIPITIVINMISIYFLLTKIIFTATFMG